MYEFPPTSELNHFIGDTLMQVCLDPHSTQFRFERNRLLSELALEQVQPDGAVWRYECTAHEGGPVMLHRLIGKKIVSVQSEKLRLSIVFDNGAVLHVMSDLGQYEAGNMTGRDGLIVF